MSESHLRRTNQHLRIILSLERLQTLNTVDIQE